MDIFIDTLDCLLEIFVEFYFYMKLIQKKPGAAHYVIFTALGYTLIHYVPAALILRNGMCILLLIGWGVFISKKEFGISLLYAVMTVEVMQLCYGISGSTIATLSPFLFLLNRKHELVGTLVMVFGSLFGLSLAGVCLKQIERYFTVCGKRQSQSIPMIVPPLLMILMASTYINYEVYGNVIQLDRRGNVTGTNHILMLAFQIFGIFSLFCISYANKKLEGSVELGMRLKMMEQETRFQKQYVEEACSRYKQTQAFRHDLKNHLSVIHALIQRKDCGQAQKYLQGIEQLTSSLSFPCHTNRPVLDILIENKLGIAKSMGVDVSCHLEVPAPCEIEDLDFCIILSNALDNAIHACGEMEQERERYIRLSGYRQGDFLVIEVKNSCEKDRTCEKGTGLSNIQSVANKYNGAMSTKCRDQSFCLSVLLIIPQPSENIPHQTD